MKFNHKIVILFATILGFLCFPVQVNAEGEAVVAEEEIVHHHTGSSAGGGCYNQPVYSTRTESQTITVDCKGTFTVSWQDDNGNWKTTCTNGHEVSGKRALHSKCSETETRTTSRTVTYIHHYEMNCGCADGEVLGKLGLSISTTEWATNVDLTAYFISGESNFNTVSYKWNTGETTPVINVTANGTYYVDVSYKERNCATVFTTRLTYEVANIDRVAPEVTPVLNDSIWEYDKTFKLDAVDKNDIADCVGLHTEAYRFYDKEMHSWTEWQSSPEYLVTENGEYSWECRDKLGNTTKGDFKITHIDYTAPELVVQTDLVNWQSSKKVEIKHSRDNQSGLNPNAFRFYNGKSWTPWGATMSWNVTENGTCIVEARDNIVERNGNTNVTSQTFEINRIDAGIAEGDIKVTYSPSTLTKDSVLVTIEATCPAGLYEPTPYSFDYGNNWQIANQYVFNENTETFGYVRSISGKTAQAPIVIDWIDHQKPQIFRVDTEENVLGGVNIKVKAKDNKKLADEAYSFDGGTTWQSASEANLEEKPTYYICVRDYVGNIANYTLDYDIDFGGVTNIVPSEGEQEEDLYLVTKLKGLTGQTKIYVREGTKTNPDTSSGRTLKVIDGDISALMSGLGYEKDSTEGLDDNVDTPLMAIGAIALGTLGLGLLAGAWRNTVKVKVVDEEKNKTIARTFLKKNNKKLYIDIKDKWFRNTKDITLEFNKQMLNKHASENITVLGNTEKLSTRQFKIAKEVVISHK